MSLRRLSPTDMLRTRLLALALACLIGVHQAGAHAVLVEQDPGDGAVLEAAPAAITLRFNEAVTPIFLRLHDGEGRVVEGLAPPRSADQSVVVALPPGLATGRYIVSWRVASGDSHPVGGGFIFGIGVSVESDGRIAADTAAERDRRWLLAKIVLRFIQDVALLLAAGGGLYMVLVLRGGRFAGGAVLAAQPWAIGIATLAATFGIGVQGALMAQAPLAGLLDVEIWELGGATTIGLTALAMIGGLSIMTFGELLRDSPFARGLVVLGAVAALASLGLSGHGATAEPRWLAQPALMLHVVCAAFWIGSLWPLLVVLRGPRRAHAQLVLRRFSNLAVPAVIMLAAAGIAMATTRLGEPGDVLRGLYGPLLLAKLGGFAALIVLAAVNRLKLVPLLAESRPAATAQLTRTIAAELVLAVVVLALTALLAHTPPPASAHLHVHDESPPVGHTVVTRDRNRVLTLAVEPALAGRNRLILWLADGDNRPVDALEMAVEASLPDRGIEPVRRLIPRVAAGRHELATDLLAIPGRWSLRIDALVTDFDKSIFETEVTIAPPPRR